MKSNLSLQSLSLPDSIAEISSTSLIMESSVCEERDILSKYSAVISGS